MPDPLQVICLVLLAVLLVGAAVQDLWTMRIPNGVPLAVVVLFAIFAAAGLTSGWMAVESVAAAVACAVLVFVLGAAAFAAGALGGGDVKLLASVSLFAGPAHLLELLTITVLTGGVLGIAILAGAPIGQAANAGDGGRLRQRLRGSVPYGPAIAASGLWLAAALGLN